MFFVRSIMKTEKISLIHSKYEINDTFYQIAKRIRISAKYKKSRPYSNSITQDCSRDRGPSTAHQLNSKRVPNSTSEPFLCALASEVGRHTTSQYVGLGSKALAFAYFLSCYFKGLCFLTVVEALVTLLVNMRPPRIAPACTVSVPLAH